MEVGRQTPTLSVVLPYTETKGPEAVALYNATERTALEWQEALCFDIMAVNDDGLWVHQIFGYSIPRRNGKSENVLMRCLWGLKNGERILYTAHRATTSHSVWERLERMCKKTDIPVESSFRAFGKEHIYTSDGGVIEFRTRTSSGGLGEGYDLLIVDEAQEYTPDQETALKYVVTDSLNPQTIMLGTPPTAISAGTVFPKFRATVLSGEGYDAGWAEWSVSEMTDPHDVNAWYETNPSMGFHLDERKIRAEIREDPIDFNIQRLGLWLQYNQKSAISPNEWEALSLKALPRLSGKLYVGIKFGNDGSNVSMSIAVKTEDGKRFLECIDCRPVREGFEWIAMFLDKADTKKVVIDGAGKGDNLAEMLRKLGIKGLFLPKVADIIRANAVFEADLNAGAICHMEQASVEQIVSNCEKRAIGSNGGFGYKSIKIGADVSILDSMVLANWACFEDKGRVQSISY